MNQNVKKKKIHTYKNKKIQLNQTYKELDKEKAYDLNITHFLLNKFNL